MGGTQEFQSLQVKSTSRTDHAGPGGLPRGRGPGRGGGSGEASSSKWGALQRCHLCFFKCVRITFLLNNACLLTNLATALKHIFGNIFVLNEINETSY